MSEKEKLKGSKGFQDQETLGISPWMLSLVAEWEEQPPAPYWSYASDEFLFEIIKGGESLWLRTHFPAGGQIAFRLAYCPDGELLIDEIVQRELGNGVEIHLRATVGAFRVELEFPRNDRPLVHYRTSLTPSVPLRIPFWPRDILPLGKEDDLMQSEGIIYARQVETRTGLVYFSLTKPRGGAVLYFQNLSSLNDYCKQLETSVAGTVGGQWPELGLAMPASGEKALNAGQELVISDAYVIASPTIPKEDLVMAEQFLDFLAQIYLTLPQGKTKYIHWPELLGKSLRDLTNSAECWSEERGRSYLNAYVADADNPPESMVQLTVLLPLLEYAEWIGEEIPITAELLAGLPAFFDRKANVFGRWLPSAAHRLDSSEPQKQPEVMDSWYLYHSLINLSRLALHGDKTAKKLFLDSMEHAIRVAKTFDYHWPVFYDLYSLKILKAETEDGAGGETDVAGLYAHLMLQAWELTKEDRYLEEAKKAARTLKGLGFNLFYQANETLFGAGALLRLWKITGDPLFLQLSYLSLANIFNNVWLWDCEYGYGEHYPTFFALFPLKDAPYTAVYEELEGFAALHDYLGRYGQDAPEWLRILAPEFIRHLLYRASFYYPPNLPEEMLSKEPRSGEIDPSLWIPLEDMSDGWEKAGQVGQEVYGAGMPFGLVPRHYWQVPDEKFMIYVDYPIRSFSTVEERTASFRVISDPRLSCRLRLIPRGKTKLPVFEVISECEGESQTLKGRKTPDGHIEYELPGDRTIIVHWEKDRDKRGAGKIQKAGKKGSKT